ncbi:uncharacterized protein LOC133350732 [Lethenteron reissneri]|uniref:uncharacterized protein LOC133350732 n=1 Tax=Lethenteron reissneri TaxID=7753 RepID=UPI002AB71003|nr:uncharacterized protein LOC133350732 [Lethenteron reissneri]
METSRHCPGSPGVEIDLAPADGRISSLGLLGGRVLPARHSITSLNHRSSSFVATWIRSGTGAGESHRLHWEEESLGGGNTMTGLPTAYVDANSNAGATLCGRPLSVNRHTRGRGLSSARRAPSRDSGRGKSPSEKVGSGDSTRSAALGPRLTVAASPLASVSTVPRDTLHTAGPRHMTKAPARPPPPAVAAGAAVCYESDRNASANRGVGLAACAARRAALQAGSER